MYARTRARFLIILLVTLSSVGLYLHSGINLGLDLKGGEYLVLQVVTDDAVRGETDHVIPSLGMTAGMRTAINEFTVSSDNARSKAGQLADWEEVAPSRFRLKPAAERTIRERSVEQTKEVIQNRLDKFGVAEMNISRYGTATDYQLLVELPGVTNPDRVKGIIQATAILEFKLVDAGPFPNEAAVFQNYNGTIPQQLELLQDAANRYYTVHRIATVSGTDLKDAFRSQDENGRPAVGFAFTSGGAKRFGDLTEQNIGRILAVVLDGRIQSAARIDTRIAESGIIRGGAGGFKVQEADDLVLVLKSGALPASIKYGEDLIVGPSLGADSIRQGVISAIVALAAVAGFMLFYYRRAGLNAVCAMVLNLTLLLGSMALFGSTLTLPGIAGIILTIGVGIDSNVLVFERIREELKAGKTAVSAVHVAFQRVFVTLVDTHMAALISAAFLFIFGTGAIRGFAVTLVIGLASNLFTSVFVSRTLFDWTLERAGRAEVQASVW